MNDLQNPIYSMDEEQYNDYCDSFTSWIDDEDDPRDEYDCEADL